MKIKIYQQKLWLNNCILQEHKNKDGKVIKNYKFQAWLGKKKGYITCKCYIMKHDMCKLRFIDNVLADLINYKFDGKSVYELKIITYAEPKFEDFKPEITIPVVKKDNKPKEEVPEEMINMVDINQEIPPMEEQTDWVELTNNYNKQGE